MEERKFWNRYMQAYEECLSVTSTSAAAWFVGPADDEKSAPLLSPGFLSMRSKNFDEQKVSDNRRSIGAPIRRHCRVRVLVAWPALSGTSNENIEPLSTSE